MLVKISPLKDVLTLAGSQTDEVTIRPDGEGWRIYAKSLDNVSLVDLRLNVSAFKDYVAGDMFAVNIDKILGAMKFFREEFMSIEISDRMILKSGTLRQTLALYTVSVEIPKTLNLPTNSVCTVFPEDICVAIDAAPSDVDMISLEINEGLSVSAINNDTQMGAVLTIPEEECIACSGQSKGGYSVTFLSKFLKKLPKGTEITLKSADRFPLIVSFECEFYTGTYFLAPWIEG